MSLLLQIAISFVLGLCFADPFLPDRSDYDVYGPTTAANDFMIFQCDNDYNEIYFQFAPYNDSINYNNDRFCALSWVNSSVYVRAVSVGKNQSANKMFAVAEYIDYEKFEFIGHRIFIKVFTYTGSLDRIDCNALTTEDVTVEFPLVHSEHLVMITDSLNLFVNVISDRFSIFYNINKGNLFTIPETNVFSRSIDFKPFAIDYDGEYGIVAGFLFTNQTGRIIYTPTVILFNVNISASIVVPINNWSFPVKDVPIQARLGADSFTTYQAKLGMSVSINPRVKQVLVGMQWMNMLLLFNYTTTTLTLITLKDNGQETVGFGKTVAWLGDTMTSFAVLVNNYSREYEWSLSQIYTYNSPFTNISKPISVFPNIQQPLYSYFSPVLLNIITTPNHLVLLDDSGFQFVIVSAPIGYYTSTIGPSDLVFPAISSIIPFGPGRHKDVVGTIPCSLCMAGTKSDGTNATRTACVNCAIDTFCPLGSVTDSISIDDLANVIQVVPYPKSPDINGLDDILFFTLFSIGSTPRCILLSPIFWTLIVTAIIILITAVMLVIKRRTKDSKANKISKLYVALFRRVDLIREGEMWAGGLATFSVLVLSISCCVFSAKFYTSYPIETAESSSYTCDTNLRNAQFWSSLQSTSIPVSEGIQEMIDLLDDQVVNLNVDFINTLYNCTSNAITLTYFPSTNSLPIHLSPSCTTSNYIVSYSTLLPFRLITVQYTISDTHTIGGVRIGLSAPGTRKSSTLTLQDLNFSHMFYKMGRVLGHDVYSTLTLTKVINSTSPLVNGDDDVLSGIWTGSFTINYNNSFVSDTDYLTASSSNSHLTLTISEASYYVFNEQSPIARLPEIIYQDFLFITMIIGMFVLVFVIVEVMILPCCIFLIRKCKRKLGGKHQEENRRQSHVSPDHLREKDLTQPNYNEASLNSVITITEQIATSNKHMNLGEDEGQQLPSESNHETHF